MDFESIIKIIVVAITAVGVPVAAYAAIVATRAIWVKPGQQGDKVEELGQEVESLRARLNEVEGQQNRIAELEERRPDPAGGRDHVWRRLEHRDGEFPQQHENHGERERRQRHPHRTANSRRDGAAAA